MNPIQKNLIKELKLEHLSEKEAEKRLENVGLIIYQNVLMHVMDMLTDEEQDQFEKLLDENAHPNEIFMFLNKKVPGFEEIIKVEAKKFYKHTDSIMGKIGK